MSNRFNYFPVFNLILLLLIVLVSYILTLVPLTNVLGYEFSLIMGIFLSFFGGLSLINYKRKIGNKNRQYWFYLLVLALPLAISAITTKMNNICPVTEGVLFYLVFAVTAFFVGLFLGRISFAVSRKFSFLIFILVWLFILFLPFFEIYFYPQIYFYNSIIGFFPGTIYDENIEITSKLVIYKFFILVFFYYSYVFVNNVKMKRAISFIIVLIVFLIFFFAKPFLGLATNYISLEGELSVKVKTEHFNIYYDASYSEKDIGLISKLHEYYFENISEKLGYEPSEKIVSFIFRDADQKRDLFGAGAADVTKTWQRSIFTDKYENTLEHELVHIFSADIGVTPFKVAENFNPAMIEGYATAVENQVGDHTVHYMAALAVNNGYTVDLNLLFKGFNFFGSNSSIGYIYSGSFIKFLMDRYGINEVNRLYSDINFNAYFGKSLEKLSAEHLDFLKSLDYKFNPSFANLMFGYKPLIRKACPRYIANKLERAWKDYSNKNFPGAKRNFKAILDVAENYSALSGYAYASKETGDYLDAVQTMLKYKDKFKNTSNFYSYELLLGDMFSLNNEFYESVEIYDSLKAQNPTPYFYSLANLRKVLLEKNELVDYLKGSSYDKYKILKQTFPGNLPAFSIPVFINLSKDLNESYQGFLQYLESRKISNDRNSAYAYFQLSEYALQKNDFEKAEEYILNALKENEDVDFGKIIEKELKKIKWLQKNI